MHEQLLLLRWAVPAGVGMTAGWVEQGKWQC